MAREIERKFLVRGDAWKPGSSGVRFRQGYLSRAHERIVRVRSEGRRAVLTVKGLTTGVTRLEFEYEIPIADAAQILDRLCEPPLIDKTRYDVTVHGRTWHVDEFHGANQGLVIAEIELHSADEAFERPPWLGREVSNDPRYFNANLTVHPYSTWTGTDNDA